MRRVLHLSDLHYHKREEDNVRADAAVAAAQEVYCEGDVVVVSGDVTDDGGPEQYARALAALRPLRALAPLVVVPGNHDYGFLGNLYSRKAHARFTAFARALGVDYAEIALQPTAEDPGLVVVTVDSCIRSFSPFDFARGRVGFWQRRRLRKRLDVIRARGWRSVVVLHHHPFYRNWTMRLEDAAAFLNVVDGRADLVCFGHTHEMDDERWPAAQTDKPALTLLRAAAAARNEGAKALRIYTFEEAEWR